MPNGYEIACYDPWDKKAHPKGAQRVPGFSRGSRHYFPNYPIDPRNEAVHATGWTEWELVKQATPRFPGHRQPRTPLWGYEDESDPTIMAKKIDAAADHGIDVFLFDWYFYNDGPFLERCLEQGFTLPYYPNVTMGWDSSPRTLQSEPFLNAGYPFMPMLSGNTPAAFEQALHEVKQFLDQQDAPRIFTINAWNEWTEGSYLEPDTVDGMTYLEAIRTLFGQASG